jgi:hypothetical protein
LPTTGISLVREHTLQMQLPRFLWVPFALGRPFGASNEPDFQRRVLRSALELFEGHDGPVVLADFPDDAPDSTANDEEEAIWACPISFHPPAEKLADLVTATLEEIERLAPWHEIYSQRRGMVAVSASGLDRERVVKILGQFMAGETSPEVEVDGPIQEWLRLGCDDLRTWYLEAAQGQPGRGSATALRDWFWCDTAAARLIGAAARRLLEHPDPVVQFLAARALVPREYLPELMPVADASEGEAKEDSRP